MNSGTRSLSASHASHQYGNLPAVHGRPSRLKLRPWPLFSGLGPVGALPTAPGVARGFTATVLGGWDLASQGDLGESSALVVSELATNVIDRAADTDRLYLPDGRMTVLWLRLMSDRAALRVEVWDNLPPAAGFPVLRNPEACEEHGRGLAVVQQLSRAWGWHPVPGKRAKCTWAVLQALLQPMQHSAVSGKGLDSPDVEVSGW
jgi:hypothetical protein